MQASKEILYFDLRSANGQRVSREVEIESPKPTPVKNKKDQSIVSAPGAERKRDEQNKEKKEGAEHEKGEAKSQGKRENSKIKLWTEGHTTQRKVRKR